MGYEVKLTSMSRGPRAGLQIGDPPMTITREWKSVAKMTATIRSWVTAGLVEARDIREKKAEAQAKQVRPEKQRVADRTAEVEAELLKVPRRTYQAVADQFGITRDAVQSIARDLRRKRKG